MKSKSVALSLTIHPDIKGKVFIFDSSLRIDMEQALTSYKTLTGTDLTGFNINSIFIRYE